MRKWKVMLVMVMVLILTLFACNGGGSSGNGGSDPVISGTKPVITEVILKKWIDSGYQRDYVRADVFDIGDRANFSLYATDLDQDMETMIISEYLSPDFQTPVNYAEALLPDQIDPDMRYELLEDVVVAGPPGEWRICMVMIDSEGSESNEYCVDYTIEGAEPAGRLGRRLSRDPAGMNIIDSSIWEGE